MSAGYRLVLTRAIPQVTEVRLYDETWEHITEGHPEFAGRLPSLEHAVVNTIAEPTAIHMGRFPFAAFVFTSTNNTKGSGAYRMVVPVTVVAGTSARVSTAMFSREPGTPRVWTKGDGNG